MRVVVTGGAGFIGSPLVRTLRADGHAVIVVDDLSGDSVDDSLPAEPNFHRLDVCETGALAELSEDADVMVHLASSVLIRDGQFHPARDLQQVVIGTHSALEAARLSGVAHFCFASTAAVYGEQAVRPTPESVELRPRSLYAAAKAAAEHFVRAYSELFPLTTTILRFGNVLGPRLRRGVVYDFVSQISKGASELRVLGDGRQRKSYLWVDDCVRGIATLGLNEVPPGIFNLAADGTVGVSRIAELVVAGGDRPALRVVYGKGAYGWPGDVPLLELSAERAAGCGWRAVESAEGAVRRCIDVTWSGASA